MQGTFSEQFHEEISTVAAAAKYHLTPSYVARLARTHIVHARKFGRDWIIDEATLREYLAQPRKTGPKPRGKRPGKTNETLVLGNPEREKHDAEVQEQSRDSHLFQSEQVDVREYAVTLVNYCDTWQQGATFKAVSDIRKCLRSLERSTLYSSSPEKAQMIELLCGYQILAADVASEQIPGAAHPILTQTIDLSREGNLYNIHAHALRQRAGASIDAFEQIHDQSVLKQALRDFQEAEGIQPHVSTFYQALVDIRRGLAYAYVARDSSQFTRALNIIDSASKQIGKQSDDRRIAARLDEERYRLNRASAYLYSPQGSPKLALSELDQAVEVKPDTAPRRGVHRDLLFAETYMTLENYSMAVAYASEAVEVSAANGMDTLFNRLENVYRTLRNSPYGKDPDVARLGVQILKARQPELFA